MSHAMLLAGPTFTAKCSVVTVNASAAWAVPAGATSAAKEMPAAARMPRRRDRRMVCSLANTNGDVIEPRCTLQRRNRHQVTLWPSVRTILSPHEADPHDRAGLGRADGGRRPAR